MASTLNIRQHAEDQGLPTAQAGVSAGEKFAQILGSILSAVMIFSAIMLLLYLVWGAIDWIVSAGDKGKVEAARNKITTSVIGMFVLASVIAMFMLVQYVLNISVLNFDFRGSGFQTGNGSNTTQQDMNGGTNTGSTNTGGTLPPKDGGTTSP